MSITGGQVAGGFLFAATVFLFSGVSAAQEAGAERGLHPALWEVTKDEGRAYIFGSHHRLKRRTTFVTPTITAAANDSDLFLFEVPVEDEAMPAAQDFIDHAGFFDEGETLSELLSPGALDSYQTVLRSLRLSARNMDRMRPWLAQLTLASAFYGDRNFDVRYGADVRVLAYAVSRDRPVEYLESPRQQLEFFVDAQDMDVAGFESLVSRLHERPESIDESIEAWRQGDIDFLSEHLHVALDDNPVARRILLDERNQAWATQIERMLDEGKTMFVTVGVGHLGGDGSVIDILCRRGLSVRRVPTAGEWVPRACPEAAD